MHKGIIVYIILVISIIVVWFIQFSTSAIIGADGFLHGRMTQEIINQHWFLRSLPQAHFSWLAVRFSDKDFLYHLYLIPYISIFGVILGTKIGAAVATSLLVGILIWIVGQKKPIWLTIFFTLCLFASGQFIRDTAEARPFALAILLTIIGIKIVIDKKIKYIFFVSLLFGMFHLSAWVLPVFTLLFSIILWISSGIFEWKLFSASAGGYLLSFAIHPNFPNNIYYFYLNGILVPWYAIKTGVLELGAEFFPINTQEVIGRFPMIPLGFVIIAIAAQFMPTMGSIQYAGWIMASCMFAVFALTSLRNITHLYPIFLITIVEGINFGFNKSKNIDKKTYDRFASIFFFLISLCLLFSMWKTLTITKNIFISDAVYSDHFLRVAAFINARIPKGERIFHTNWSDSQFLIGLAPDYEYFVTFDPIYMYTYNKKLYELYRDISFGRTNDPYQAIMGNFKAYYGYAGKNYFTGFIDQIRKDKRFTVMAEDNLGLVYKIEK